MADPLSTEELPCACGCGTSVGPDKRGRPRRFVHGHNARGRELTTDHTDKVAASLRGVPLSPEHRAALRGPREGARGANNAKWRGDDAGYHAVHLWLNYHFGHEKTVCEKCGASKEEKRLEWAFKSRNSHYTRNREDYRILCVSCHRIFDLSKHG